MEFEELQQAWDTQNNKPIYFINENALHNRILTKQRQAHHIINISELGSLLVNMIAGAGILAANFYKQNIFLYLLAGWMFVTALYLLVSRIRRTRGNKRFDRSMLGDLRYAIFMATHQVRLSQYMRWNVLPVGTLILLSVWQDGKSIWLAVGILIFFLLTFYASRWEHNIYKKKKRELEQLQSKLESENGGQRGI